MPGFMQFIAGVYLFLGLTLFGTFRTPALYMAAPSRWLGRTGPTRSKFASRMAQLSLLPAVLAKLVWVWRCGSRAGGDGHAGAIQAGADAAGTPAGA